LGGILALHSDVGHAGVADRAFLGQLDLSCDKAIVAWSNLANPSARKFAIV
jgi:hypothetical protein